MPSESDSDDKLEIASITIPTDGGDFSAAEFAEELLIFDKLYRLSASQHASFVDLQTEIQDEPARADWVAQTVVNRFSPVFSYTPQTLLTTEIPMPPDVQSLRIVDIYRRNPIEVIAACVAVPLAAAVIISGGKIQFGPLLRVELAPLGDGLAKIRAAFTKEKVEGEAKRQSRRLKL
jgi:hypothetical protein